MRLEQLEFDFGNTGVVGAQYERAPIEIPQIRTSVLGELPNDCGVYVCPPDEVLVWTNKNDFVKVKLLKLENGKQLFSFDISIGNSGICTPLVLSGNSVDSRTRALQYAQNTLRGCYILGDGELSSSMKNSLSKFIDGLV